MTTPLPISPTPYISPATLTAAPTGVSWSTIPPGSGVTEAQHLAEQSNICGRATAEADECCNQVLRATLDTEVFRGPDFRVTVQQTGNARIILQRWPVLEVVSVKVCPAALWPRKWTTVPSGYYEPEYPPIGLYGTVAPSGAANGGQAIIIAPGYINWCQGRQGWIAEIQYINGWPHAGITTAASAGAASLQVDDCTGWAITSAFSGVTGAAGVIKDAGSQEVIQVTAASQTAGPGTLTLASALRYAHDAGVIVTTLPASAEWAVIMLATAQALTRGATSTTVHAIPGGAQPSIAGKGIADLRVDAARLLGPYARTI